MTDLLNECVPQRVWKQKQGKHGTDRCRSANAAAVCLAWRQWRRVSAVLVSIRTATVCYLARIPLWCLDDIWLGMSFQERNVTFVWCLSGCRPQHAHRRVIAAINVICITEAGTWQDVTRHVPTFMLMETHIDVCWQPVLLELQREWDELELSSVLEWRLMVHFSTIISSRDSSTARRGPPALFLPWTDLVSKAEPLWPGRIPFFLWDWLTGIESETVMTSCWQTRHPRDTRCLWFF